MNSQNAFQKYKTLKALMDLQSESTNYFMRPLGKHKACQFGGSLVIWLLYALTFGEYYIKYKVWEAGAQL